jgi:hypothetical protein
MKIYNELQHKGKQEMGVQIKALFCVLSLLQGMGHTINLKSRQLAGLTWIN